jgi:hypothetical protein
MHFYDTYLQTIEEYQGTSISRRDVILQFPSIAIQLINEYSVNQTLLAEMVLQKFSMDLKQYLDSRISLDILSKNFYLFFQEKKEVRKTLIIGPVNSPRYILTDDSFYNF